MTADDFVLAEEVLCLASVLAGLPDENTVRPRRKPIRFNWTGTPTPDEISAAQVVNYESEIA